MTEIMLGNDAQISKEPVKKLKQEIMLGNDAQISKEPVKKLKQVPLSFAFSKRSSPATPDDRNELKKRKLSGSETPTSSKKLCGVGYSSSSADPRACSVPDSPSSGAPARNSLLKFMKPSNVDNSADGLRDIASVREHFVNDSKLQFVRVVLAPIQIDPVTGELIRSACQMPTKLDQSDRGVLDEPIVVHVPNTSVEVGEDKENQPMTNGDMSNHPTNELCTSEPTPESLQSDDSTLAREEIDRPAAMDIPVANREETQPSKSNSRQKCFETNDLRPTPVKSVTPTSTVTPTSAVTPTSDTKLDDDADSHVGPTTADTSTDISSVFEQSAMQSEPSGADGSKPPKQACSRSNNADVDSNPDCTPRRPHCPKELTVIMRDLSVTPSQSEGSTPASSKKHQVSSAKKAERLAQRQRVCEEREKARQKVKEEKQREKEEKQLARHNKMEKLKREKQEMKEQKEKERQELLLQKQKEKQEKLEDEQRRKQAALEAKNNEKRKKDEEKNAKEEEKRVKEEEKRLKEEEKIREKEEEMKKIKKVQDKFQRFFTKTKVSPPQTVKPAVTSNFMPFELKENMWLAPCVRRRLNSEEKSTLLDLLNQQDSIDTYIEKLKDRRIFLESRRSFHSLNSDVMVISDDAAPLTTSNYPAKLFLFHTNYRPPYFGTWRKRSSVISARNPFRKDEALLDYEVDSDDEWEEEEPGESLSHSEGEEKDEENEEEEEDGWMVPHGYLSAGEGCEEEGEVNHETLKLRQKAKQDAWDRDLKHKQAPMKARVIGCIWEHGASDDPIARDFLLAFQISFLVSAPIDPPRALVTPPSKVVNSLAKYFKKPSPAAKNQPISCDPPEKRMSCDPPDKRMSRDPAEHQPKITKVSDEQSAVMSRPDTNDSSSIMNIATPEVHVDCILID